MGNKKLYIYLPRVPRYLENYYFRSLHIIRKFEKSIFFFRSIMRKKNFNVRIWKVSNIQINLSD